MPMWWGDFFNKTDHLSNAEQWAYAKLLAKTWLRNCTPFPDNNKDLARYSGYRPANGSKSALALKDFLISLNAPGGIKNLKRMGRCR